MNGQNTLSPTIGDDTIELELTPEQWRHLSQAADAAVAEQLVEPAQFSDMAERDPIPPEHYSSPQPLPVDNPVRHLRRWQMTPIAKMSGYVIAYAAFAWWSVSQLAGQPKAPATPAVRPAAVITRPALVASAAPSEVKVVNPFDATEVFAFPAGTSNAEGREKVAQILLQRAHERQSHWERTRTQVSLRTASLYRSP